MTNKLDCVLHVNEKIEQFWLNCAVVVEDKNLELYLIKSFQVLWTYMNLSKLIRTCPNLSKPIQTYSNLSKPIWTYLNLSEPSRIYSNLSKPARTYPKLSKPIQTYPIYPNLSDQF